MSEVMIPHKAMVLVCDGAKALFLRNDGTFARPDLTVIDTMAEKHAASHELGTDQPGRAYSSAHGRSSGVAITDLHDEAEIGFIKKTADRLDQHVGDAKSEALIVVAPPRALGHLRAALSPAVAAIVIAEVDKDLTAMPTDEIAKHISA